MDGITEQEKDCKLYELICKSLLSDRDLRKVIMLFHYITIIYIYILSLYIYCHYIRMEKSIVKYV